LSESSGEDRKELVSKGVLDVVSILREPVGVSLEQVVPFRDDLINELLQVDDLVAKFQATNADPVSNLLSGRISDGVSHWCVSL
jgi:hypothetical protein